MKVNEKAKTNIHRGRVYLSQLTVHAPYFEVSAF